MVTGSGLCPPCGFLIRSSFSKSQGWNGHAPRRHAENTMISVFRSELLLSTYEWQPSLSKNTGVNFRSFPDSVSHITAFIIYLATEFLIASPGSGERGSSARASRSVADFTRGRHKGSAAGTGEQA